MRNLVLIVTDISDQELQDVEKAFGIGKTGYGEAWQGLRKGEMSMAFPTEADAQLVRDLMQGWNGNAEHYTQVIALVAGWKPTV